MNSERLIFLLRQIERSKRNNSTTIILTTKNINLKESLKNSNITKWSKEELISRNKWGPNLHHKVFKFSSDSIIKYAIWNVEKDLIDIAKQVIGEVKGEDPFNLGGQTETFGWFRSVEEAFGAAKEIARTFASYKPETLDREKITVFNWIEGKEVT